MTSSPFDSDFFSFYEKFGRVKAGIVVTPSTSIPKPDKCLICGAEFKLLGAKAIQCNNCKLHYCKDCIREDKGQKCCGACLSLDKQRDTYDINPIMKNWKDIKQYDGINLSSPAAASYMYFISLLKIREKPFHANAMYVLSRVSPEKLVINEAAFPVLLEHIQKCDCEAKATSIELFNDLICRYPLPASIKVTYQSIEPLLDISSPEISAATARLVYNLTEKKQIRPDKKKVIELYGAGNKIASAYISGALARLYPITSVFHMSSSRAQYKYDHSRPIIHFAVSMFSKTSKNSTLASKYYSAILLYRMTQTDQGAEQLLSFQLSDLSEWACLFAPKTQGMVKHESQISIYIGAIFRNLVLFIGKTTQPELLPNLVTHAITCMFDISSDKGYDPYSYYSCIQSIYVDILLQLEQFEDYKTLVESPQLQEFKARMLKQRENSQVVENQKMVHDLEEETQRLQNLTQQRALTIEQFQEINDKLQLQVKELQQSITDKESTIAMLTSSSQSSESELKQKLSQLQDANTQQDNLIKQKDEQILNLTQQNGIKEAKINQQTTEIETMEKEIEDKAAEIKNLKEQLEQLQKKSDEDTEKKNSEIEGLKKDLENKSEEFEKKQEIGRAHV